MVETDRVTFLFHDARDLFDKALEQLERGDLRDAADSFGEAGLMTGFGATKKDRPACPFRPGG